MAFELSLVVWHGSRMARVEDLARRQLGADEYEARVVAPVAAASEGPGGGPFGDGAERTASVGVGEATEVRSSSRAHAEAGRGTR